MAKSNAQRQAEYRKRHLKDINGKHERLNMVISYMTKNKLERLASYYGVTQIEMLKRVITKAEDNLLSEMDNRNRTAYYDKELTI